MLDEDGSYMLISQSEHCDSSPGKYMARGNIIEMQFTSDGSLTRMGFRVSYKAFIRDQRNYALDEREFVIKKRWNTWIIVIQT